MKAKSSNFNAWIGKIVAVTMALVPIFICSAASAQVKNFVNIDVPGATLTRPNDINNNGVIVGRYDDATGVHGFVLDRSNFSTVDYPGASKTSLLGINDSGQVVGWFAQGGVEHGFLLSGGAFSEIDFPGAISTQCHGINKNGDIVGRYFDGRNPGQGGGGGRQQEHGFLLRDGAFTSVDYPDSATTDAWKITDGGDIVGDWSTNATLIGSQHIESVHGYILRDGEFTSFDVPGALNTGSREMNASGQVVGIYSDQKFVEHGFVLAGGSYSRFDLPDSMWTDGNAINDHGLIVGSYGDSAGVEHGFVASLKQE